MRARLFDVGVETGNHILVTLFDDAAFHFHCVSEFAAGVGEILLEQSEALGLFVLREGRGEALYFAAIEDRAPTDRRSFEWAWQNRGRLFARRLRYSQNSER